eukprot:407804-Rhodomonas_salina.2
MSGTDASYHATRTQNILGGRVAHLLLDLSGYESEESVQAMAIGQAQIQVSAYALAMRYPVLTWYMVLAAYTLATPCLINWQGFPGTLGAPFVPYLSTDPVASPPGTKALPPYAAASPCPVLTDCMVLPEMHSLYSEKLLYAPGKSPLSAYAQCPAPTSLAATRTRLPKLYQVQTPMTLCLCYSMSVIALCLCYAMSGTDPRYGATGHLPMLRACGIDLLYGATAVWADANGHYDPPTVSRKVVSHIVLSTPYEMSGTDTAYGAASFSASLRSTPPSADVRACYAMSGIGIAYGAISLCAWYAMSSTDKARHAICLRVCYAMYGTDIAYGATSRIRLSGTLPAYAMVGTDTAYGAIRLHGCYVMSGTEVAYDLRGCYAMSGTEVAYGATRMAWMEILRIVKQRSVWSRVCGLGVHGLGPGVYNLSVLRTSHATSGTDLQHFLLRNIHYYYSCYAMSDTDLPVRYGSCLWLVKSHPLPVARQVAP